MGKNDSTSDGMVNKDGDVTIVDGIGEGDSRSDGSSETLRMDVMGNGKNDSMGDGKNKFKRGTLSAACGCEATFEESQA
eukprot:9676487-Heterocapsa_arctica.AAC.1